MKRTVKSRDTVAIAGWLFADLLLGVAMLFFVFNTVGEPLVTATRTPTVTPTLTPTPTPTPSPTGTRLPTVTPTPTMTSTSTPTPTLTPSPSSTPTPSGGLDPEPEEISFIVDANSLLSDNDSYKQAEQTRVRDIIREKLERFSGFRAGMVLSTGTTLFTTPSQGRMMADEVNELLRDVFPRVFAGAIFKSFHFLSNDPARVGEIELEIYWIME